MWIFKTFSEQVYYRTPLDSSEHATGIEGERVPKISDNKWHRGMGGVDVNKDITTTKNYAYILTLLVDRQCGSS